jgi:hypothetical protein
VELSGTRSPLLRPAERGLAAGPPRSSLSRARPRITDRDVTILAWIGRHGVVTPAQVARHFFARDGGAIGQWAAYRRLRALECLALVRHDRTFWRETSVLRLTGAGTRLANIDLRPAHLVLAEIRHTLAVVDLVEALLTNSPPGTVLRTERELRAQRRRELRAGIRKPGQGRMPDAVFIHPSGGKAAIELDLTPKRAHQLQRILAAYRQERYHRVVWYVLPRQHERVRALVAKHRADDFVEVRVWHGR